MQSYRSMKPAFAGLLGCALAVTTAQAQDSPLRGGTIGYVLTAKNVAIWQSPDGKVECPQWHQRRPTRAVQDAVSRRVRR